MAAERARTDPTAQGRPRRSGGGPLAAHRAGWDPQPVLALVRLAQGDAAAAAASIRDALERPLRVPSKERPPNTALQRAPLLEAQVEIEIAAGDLDRARSAADELESVAARFESKALVASAALAEEGCASPRATRPAPSNRCPTRCDSGTRSAPRTRPRSRASASPMPTPPEAASSGRSWSVTPPRAILDEIEAQGEWTERGRHGPIRPTLAPQRVSSRGRLLVGGVRRADTARIRDLKGMRHLARLLADPAREFHVLDLVAAEGPADGGDVARLGDAGEMLDERAKEAYRRRLAEIEEDIEEAQTRRRRRT